MMQRFLYSVIACLVYVQLGWCAPVLNAQETDHFVIHSQPEDVLASTEIATLLEKNYAAVSADLDYSLTHKLSVFVYPSQAEFHRAMKVVNGPLWYVGGVKDGAIHMVTPLNMGSSHTQSGAMRLIVQRFATLVLLEKLQHVQNKSPFWLLRGLSVYATRNTPYWERYVDSAAALIMKAVTEDAVPTLSELNDSSRGDVVFSYSATQLLISRYGLAAVLGFVEDFSQFDTGTQLTLEEFEQAWRASLTVK